MQAIAPLAIADFTANGRQPLFRLEIWDATMSGGGGWAKPNDIIGESGDLLVNLTSSIGAADPQLVQIGGTWDAKIINHEGVFHPLNPAPYNTYKGVFERGVRVRLSLGIDIGGTEYFYPSMYGYIEQVEYLDGEFSLQISGMDKTQAMANRVLNQIYRALGGEYFWGDDVAADFASNAPYVLPAGAMGIVEACRLDPYSGEVILFYAENNDFTYDEGSRTVTFLPTLPTPERRGFWYYTATVMEDAIADLMVMSGLYANRAAALADMIYTPTNLVGAGTPAYGNAGGTGNRVGTIAVSSNIVFEPGYDIYENLIDGDKAGQNLFFQVPQNASGLELRFDFGTKKVITEAKFYQDTTDTHGTWKWQGSDDAVTWADIGSAFTLGGALVQTQTELAGNATGYRLYRILGTGGAVSDGPWLFEYEFKIADLIVGVPRVKFEPGTTALAAARAIAERCHYKFFFGADGRPRFLPVPAIGVPVATLTPEMIANTRPKLTPDEYYNKVVIEGEERGIESAGGASARRLHGEASDAALIAAGGEKTLSITNDLFQDQGSIDAMCVALLAELKVPKVYFGFDLKGCPLPLEWGDTVTVGIVTGVTPPYGDPIFYGTATRRYGYRGFYVEKDGIVREIKTDGYNQSIQLELEP